MIATIILLAVICIGALMAVIYGVSTLVGLVAGELRLAHDSARSHVDSLVAANLKMISDATEGALKAVSEQLGPRAIPNEDAADAVPLGETAPPFIDWEEYDPYPDPLDGLELDDVDLSPQSRAVSVPFGFPIPGDHSAENLL